MKGQVHARKQRQLKSLAKQLLKLDGAPNDTSRFLEIRAKIFFLLRELQTFFSTKSLIRTLGKSAALLGIGLSSSGLLAQQFAEPAWSPFGLEGKEYAQFSSPNLVDMDGDGDMDILITAIGQEWEDLGYFEYYENIGSASDPSYADPIINPFGLTNLPNDLRPVLPTIADLDGDGDSDVLVVASNSNGVEFSQLHYYENIGSSTEPVFDGFDVNPFGIVLTGLSHHFSDLDSDGDFDLLSGDFDFDYYNVTIRFHENTGSANTPAFESPVLLNLTNSDPQYWLSMATTDDIDNDGDMDILVGGYSVDSADYYIGSIFYFENKGDQTFEEGVLNPFGLEPNYDALYIMPAIADIDDDGDSDLLTFITGPEGDGGFSRFLLYENIEGEMSSIESINAFGIKVFPSPANDVLYIQSEDRIQQIEILDLAAKVYLTIPNETNSVPLDGLPPGFYLLKALGENGTQSIMKFEKR